jgi:predicted ester cyclase
LQHIEIEKRFAPGGSLTKCAKVAARFIMRGTHQGNFFGVSPTGKLIKGQAMNFYRFSNGQIVEEFGQPDMPGLPQQIGAVPTA